MSTHPREAVHRLLAAADAGELADLCARSRVELMVLFGSAAGGTDPADLDVAVSFERSATPDLLLLLDDLYAVTGSEDFDLLDLDRAGPLASERALVGARLLHQARPGLFATRQIAAIMERLDTDVLRRVELELMSP